MLAFTTICCGITMNSDPIKEFMITYPFLLYVCLGIMFVLSIVLTCKCCDMCNSCQRQVPYNYLILLVFTCSMTYPVAAICAFSVQEAVLSAAGITLAATIGLTIAAFRMTEEQVGFVGGVAWGMSLAALPLILFSFIFRDYFFYILCEFFFVALYCVYILYDTRVICQHFSYDDYIVGAVHLYMDIIMLFLHLLELFGAIQN